MAGGNVNTPEYRTFIALTNDLRLAVKGNLVDIGGALIACGLIVPNVAANLQNPMHAEATRAADLTTLLSQKIQQDANNYHKFVEVLKQDYMQYKHILSKLTTKYTTELECQPNGMNVA